MTSKYLVPYRMKPLAIAVLIPTVLFGVYVVQHDLEPDWLDATVPAFFFDEFFGDRSWFKMTENNLLNELLGIVVIVSSLVVAFSKERIEDEYIAKIRLESLVWAVWVNYIILILAFVLVYELTFFWVMIINMFTTLWAFILRFNWKTYQLRKALSNDQ